MQVTAIKAKNRLGFLCASTKRKPVFIERDRRLRSMMSSFNTYRAPQPRRLPVSHAVNKRASDENCAHRIAEQNAHKGALALWSEGVVGCPGKA